MDNNSIEIIVSIVTIIGAIVGGTIYFKSKKKYKRNKVIQKKIKIKGDNNKVIGGDDKSSN
ncbi:hypothetical protein ACKUSY_16280 [Myroides odoratus]